MQIGIVGAGRIGGNAGRLLARAGHEVLLSFSRDPAQLADRAAEIGARAGSPAEAAAFGEVVVLSVARERVVPALEAAARVGALGAVVFAIGFAEADTMGAGLQQRLGEIAQEAVRGQGPAGVQLLPPLLGVQGMVAAEGDFNAIGVEHQSLARLEYHLRLSEGLIGKYSQQWPIALQRFDFAVGAQDQRTGMPGPGDGHLERLHIDHPIQRRGERGL